MKFSINSIDDAPRAPGEVDFILRIRRSDAAGGLFVLLLHVVLLYALLHMGPLKKIGETLLPTALVFLDSPKKEARSAHAASKPAHLAPSAHAIHLPTPAAAPPVPTPTPMETPAAEQPMDMMAMLNAARARRQQEEDRAREENERASQGSRGPSAQEIAEANVRHSMQRAAGGTSGVFQILSKGPRMASFSFRGWRSGSSNAIKQVIEVDAGLGGDVERAVVRRMIELIRTHYSGDFNWESHRLGRVITLSARQQDQAELEAFLLKEFFGTV